jgi:2-aminoethylphosphonate-pyruvate transaminase
MTKQINMDKLLFTPGPLTTSKTVKEAMLHDYGSRDDKFVNMVREVRERLLTLAGVSREKGFETVIIQGSGTFGIEATISSSVPRDGHLLIVINGAYGHRMAKICSVHGIKHTSLVFAENEIPTIEKAETAIKADSSITHLAIVHSETTTGIFNPIKEFGVLAAKYNKTYIVDAMSSFGAVPVNVAEFNIDFLVSSSNKCIEGVPGFSFIIAKREKLQQCKDQARSLVLDIFAQWEGLENDGQFRFTPPTHSLAAFHKALEELETEGGISARATRYKENHQTLISGMRKLGFKEYLEPEKQGYIITSFLYPEYNFNFKEFYASLNDKGFVIYPGKLSKADCFRIGNIGKLYPKDVEALLHSIEQILK